MDSTISSYYNQEKDYSKEKCHFKKHKIPFDEGFFSAPNRLVIDKNLTDSGYRFLTYLISNSSDWIVYVWKTRQLLGWGRQKTEKAIANVIEFGYVKREMVREKGKFSHYVYEYHWSPVFLKKEEIKIISPQTGLPSTVEPAPVNQPLPKNKLNKEEETNTPPNPPREKRGGVASPKDSAEKKQKFLADNCEIAASQGIPPETLALFVKKYPVSIVFAALLELSKMFHSGALKDPVAFLISKIKFLNS